MAKPARAGSTTFCAAVYRTLYSPDRAARNRADRGAPGYVGWPAKLWVPESFES